jgi:hypothetical protein
MSEALDPAEQKALESLISAVLHQFTNLEPVSDEKIDQLLKQEFSLNDEQRAALQKLGSSPFEWITKKADVPGHISVVREHTPELAGMYRHGSDETLDSQTKKLIEEKRKQIIRRLREKGKNLE